MTSKERITILLFDTLICMEDSYMEWLKKLSLAIDYIESNLDKDIHYDEAAHIACCSTFYFQRLFSYITGISLSEYIKRRRMTQAGFELQRTNAKVIDVALKYGYSSPTAFNRAFRSVHSITPSDAKKLGNILNVYPPLHFSIKVTGGTVMPYHIEKKPPMRIIGVRTQLSDDMGKNQQIVPLFWKDTLNNGNFYNICKLSNQTPQGILGVSVYQSPRQFFYYIAASTDAPVSSGMFEYEIPESNWAVFENNGDFEEDVKNVFKRFFTEWLPFSGYEYAGLPDIEVYPIYENIPAKGHSEVWIAIKKDKEKEQCII